MDGLGGNLYEILGVPPRAGGEEIRRAWARRVREHTPDDSPEANMRINEARAVLMDPIATRRVRPRARLRRV